LTEDLRASEYLYATKKAELDAYRRDLMSRAVQARAEAASLATPSIPTIVASVGQAQGAGLPAQSHIPDLL